MHTAAEIGNEYTMDGLVRLGADVNIKDEDGVSETLIITAGKFSSNHPRKSPVCTVSVYRQPQNMCIIT